MAVSSDFQEAIWVTLSNAEGSSCFATCFLRWTSKRSAIISKVIPQKIPSKQRQENAERAGIRTCWFFFMEAGFTVSVRNKPPIWSTWKMDCLKRRSGSWADLQDSAAGRWLTLISSRTPWFGATWAQVAGFLPFRYGRGWTQKLFSLLIYFCLSYHLATLMRNIYFYVF